MELNELEDLKKMSTYDLAFNLAMGRYDAETKLEVLSLIRERESGGIIYLPASAVGKPERTHDKLPKTSPPLKGSKSEKIYELLNKDKTAKEVYEALNKGKKKIYVYYPEIYRVGRDYFPEKFVKK